MPQRPSLPEGRSYVQAGRHRTVRIAAAWNAGSFIRTYFRLISAGFLALLSGNSPYLRPKRLHTF